MTRTWAPRGRTPVIQQSFTWKQMSAIAGLSWWRFYFRFFAGAIKSEQIIEFLTALHKQIGKKLLIIWDGVGTHKSLWSAIIPSGRPRDDSGSGRSPWHHQPMVNLLKIAGEGPVLYGAEGPAPLQRRRVDYSELFRLKRARSPRFYGLRRE